MWNIFDINNKDTRMNVFHPLFWCFFCWLEACYCLLGNLDILRMFSIWSWNPTLSGVTYIFSAFNHFTRSQSVFSKLKFWIWALKHYTTNEVKVIIEKHLIKIIYIIIKNGKISLYVINNFLIFQDSKCIYTLLQNTLI